MKYIVQVGVVHQVSSHSSRKRFLWSPIECVFRILERGRSGQSRGIFQGMGTWRAVPKPGIESPTLLQDKDIGKYNQALAQALDGVSAKAAFIKVRRNCRAYLFPSY